jgi:hypothetical protein
VGVSGEGAIRISISRMLLPQIEFRLEFPYVVPTRQTLPTAKDYQTALHLNHAMLCPDRGFQLTSAKPDFIPSQISNFEVPHIVPFPKCISSK